jgi:RNA polymerase sigma-70 factor (ECF subfamily)
MSTAKALHVTTDPAAQEVAELFREHSRMVYRTAYSVTGSRQDAEDVVQNLFVRLLRGFPPSLRDNPKGYLYRATVNLSLNTVKSRKRQMITAGGDYGGLMTHDAGSHSTDLQEQLVDAIAQLNPRAVEMLILRYEHDYSDAEIGKLLGCSRGVVAVALYRARARLKELLGA